MPPIKGAIISISAFFNNFAVLYGLQNLRNKEHAYTKGLTVISVILIVLAFMVNSLMPAISCHFREIKVLPTVSHDSSKQHYISHLSVSIFNIRTAKFLNKFILSENSLCSLFAAKCCISIKPDHIIN